jgi:tRNA nucleotidyltransferase/poly(A) polymerase
MTNWHAKARTEMINTDIRVSEIKAEYLQSNMKPLTVPSHLLTTKIYLVGGAVREIVRGFPEKVKDWDFAVEAESYDAMRYWLEHNGFEIYLETPQYFTIRARTPKEGFNFAGFDMSNKTFDFTLCRTEGDYTDGRRPDEVKVGTLQEDLSRRDFTINAMALDASGTLIDPFGGQLDIKTSLIRCVGSTERLREDSLRMLRAIRFAVQLRFDLHSSVLGFLKMSANADLLENVDENRVRDELTKCFKVDTLDTLELLNEFPFIRNYIFENTDIWLLPTSKSK